MSFEDCHIVIDDFLDNAAEVRERALRLDYPPAQGATPYPGRNSLQQLAIEGLEDKVSAIVSEPLSPAPRTGHGRCRITLAGDKGRGNVHIDSSDWSAILYLSADEDCQGGTDFYRHKATGMERAPVFQEDMDRLGYTSFDDIIEKILKPDGNNPEAWEHLARVPMRFNRLIMLRPWLWHNAGPGFGNRLENGRLVYLMFFNTRTPAWAPIYPE